MTKAKETKQAVSGEALPVATETPEATKAIADAVTLQDAEFDAKLAQVGVTSQNVQAEYQALALSAILDCATRKDALRVNALISGMPDSMRRNSMRQFVETFGTVKFDKGSKQFAFDKTKTLRLWAANQKPWYKAIKEAEYKPFDILEQATVLLMRASKHLEKKHKGDKVTAETVNKLAAFIAEIKPLIAANESVQEPTKQVA